MTAACSIGVSAYGYEPADLLTFARSAEAYGMDTFWVGEHYTIPQQYQSEHPALARKDHDEDEILASNVRIYDPWLLLGAVAASTARLKIGTAVCVAPMLHPLLLARATVSAHDVSGGRFLCGLGAGWLKEEFDAYGIPFNERGARMDESIEVVRKAWAGGFFHHHGKYYTFESLQITPAKAAIPLVCGGNSRPALRRVGRVADAWLNSSVVSLEEALRLRDLIEAERRSQGTAHRHFTYYVRPATAAPEEVERFISEGFEDLVLWGPNVWPTSGHLDEKREAFARIALSLGLSMTQ